MFFDLIIVVCTIALTVRHLRIEILGGLFFGLGLVVGEAALGSLRFFIYVAANTKGTPFDVPLLVGQFALLGSSWLLARWRDDRAVDRFREDARLQAAWESEVDRNRREFDA